MQMQLIERIAAHGTAGRCASLEEAVVQAMAVLKSEDGELAWVEP